MGLARAPALVLLVVPLLLVAAYAASLRRRRPVAVRWSSVGLLRQALPRSSRWRRHVPATLLVGATGLLAIAVGRPEVVRQVEVGRTSIILALDVSRSMCATDVEPNRLAAAQDAAAAFVRKQPQGTRIGIVAYSGFAETAVRPTTDREALVKAIEGLTVGRGTAIGAAILKSLDAISEINPDVAPVVDAAGGEPGVPPTAGPAGAAGYVPDVVVLLTDGRNTRGIDPLDATPAAIERRVRVYTIGFGTAAPTGMSCTSTQLGAASLGGGFGGPRGGFGGGGGRGPGDPLVADDDVLRAVAERTGGTFHAAADAAELDQVFQDRPRQVERQERRVEVTWVPAALAALLLAAAVAASVRLSPYP